MCSPGEFPNDFTERMIEKYSEKVNDDGFFLGVADAFVFAVKQGKSFAIAVDRGSQCQRLSVRDSS